MAQQCLSVPSTWPHYDDTTITDPNDPLYVGAWWLGFLPITLMVVFPAILIFFFPKKWPPLPPPPPAPCDENNAHTRTIEDENKEQSVTSSQESGNMTDTGGEGSGQGRGNGQREEPKENKEELTQGQPPRSLLQRIGIGILGMSKEDAYLHETPK